jgi:hypothetical protein
MWWGWPVYEVREKWSRNSENANQRLANNAINQAQKLEISCGLKYIGLKSAAVRKWYRPKGIDTRPSLSSNSSIAEVSNPYDRCRSALANCRNCRWWVLALRRRGGVYQWYDEIADRMSNRVLASSGQWQCKTYQHIISEYRQYVKASNACELK